MSNRSFLYFLSQWRVLSCVSVMSLLTLWSTAQVKMLKIDPKATDSRLTVAHGPHIALYDRGAADKGRLILMMEGTGGSAMSMQPVDSVFATLGFHVVSLDYPNDVISTVCAHSKDSACSDHFREEIVTGRPVSGLVDVDSVNCIISRFTDLLRDLQHTDPAGNWGRFLRHGKPRWDRIVVAGHSQGSGHAAYLGKLFRVDRVLIFSGPQDYLADLQMPSPWLSMKSATPRNRYFAFLHINDPFNAHYQIANCDVLMGLNKGDTVMVSPGEHITGHPQIMVNSIATNAPHSSTIMPEFKSIWAYMLGKQ